MIRLIIFVILFASSFLLAESKSTPSSELRGEQVGSAVQDLDSSFDKIKALELELQSIDQTLKEIKAQKAQLKKLSSGTTKEISDLKSSVRQKKSEIRQKKRLVLSRLRQLYLNWRTLRSEGVNLFKASSDFSRYSEYWKHYLGYERHIIDELGKAINQLKSDDLVLKNLSVDEEEVLAKIKASEAKIKEDKKRVTELIASLTRLKERQAESSGQGLNS